MKMFTNPWHGSLLQVFIVSAQLPEVREEEPGITEQDYNMAVKLIKEFYRPEQHDNNTTKGAVLVFCLGYMKYRSYTNSCTELLRQSEY
jgi:hypothetical protein